MQFQNAPTVNGVMELTEEQKTDIRTKLETIKANFVPTIDQPICDTFCLVATYNRENEFKINGDTAESLLQEDAEEVVE